MSNLTIKVQCCVSEETRSRNIALAPDLPEPSGTGKLAIVAGGTSAANHIDELRGWDGDIWAINATHKWLRSKGIESTTFSADPQSVITNILVGSTSAILASHSDPSMFKAMDGKECYIIDGSVSGPTTSVVAAVYAVKAGYDNVHIFGCDGSYGKKTTHVGDGMHYGELIKLNCNENEYETRLEYIAQTEQLVGAIKAFPQFLKNRSGGFLKDLIESGDYTVTNLSEIIKHETQLEEIK